MRPRARPARGLCGRLATRTRSAPPPRWAAKSGSLGGGELTEVYYPNLGTPAVRDLQFVVTDGRSWVQRESEDTHHTLVRTDPRSPRRIRPGPVTGTAVLVHGVLGGVGELASRVARSGGEEFVPTIGDRTVRTSDQGVRRRRRRRLRSQGSLRRLLAIGFAAKESPDVDVPHDHSVAKAQVSSERPTMRNAIARRTASR